ncbi:MAG: protease [Prolixibacteraceae bacterium]|jgi:tricorn protease|nr:protease [Prolixibacteraceae bacterium]MBT6005093.1 protease [Prolixibacteraceae bacterium]MBT6766044.1 protease [Prolixibacteraceae bacterium]MBT6998444.1 protease [Prolixibacteraceae bacterium]MBT7397275.1 protease [Prolixibacteraceae bacterium]
MKKKFLILLTLFLVSLTFTNAQNDARLLRFPTISENNVVFSYGGDLYNVSAEGGTARKLTTHNGYEMFPKFSPDGKSIAFTGQYDGNTEVFLIPAEGGVPIRLTYTATLGRDDIGDRMGPNNLVMGWTPDGKDIIFRSRKQSFNAFKGQLFLVSKEGGLPREIPLTDGGFCSYSPDGKKLAFNWVFREFRTWKYYQGGMADDIRIFDFDTGNVEKINNTNAQEIMPMWIGNKIFFLSDRDRTMNLFSYNLDSKETLKITDFTDYDIKFPSFSKDFIVFEKGGFLYKHNVSNGENTKISITIADDQIYARNEIKDASKSIRGGDLSPNGERVVFSARGDIFSVPAKHGITRNLTASSGVHEQNADFSPDGKNIAYISDKTGEFELYMVKHDGSEPPVQLTKNNKTYIFGYEWSPDGKKILFNDKKMRLRYVDVETKKLTLVVQGDRSPNFGFNWSPDSKWITYTKPEKDFTKVRLYNVESKEHSDVTEGWYNSFNPGFSSDGKYLIFSSARDFNPVYSNTEWNHAYVDMSKIYLATLAKETPSPFALENDEVKIESEEKADVVKEKDTKKEAEDSDIVVDVDGINNRIISLPVPPANYFNVVGVENKIFFSVRSASSRETKTKVYDLKEKKETELGTGLNYTISSNGKKMLAAIKGKYEVINLPSGPVKISKPIDLTGMKVSVDIKKEWAQIFDENWRQMRDFFYAPNMHGVDWDAMHEKYSVLVPYAAHRSDLSYILGEMVGELNVGHAYVNNGERPIPERIPMGLLGAKLLKDDSGFFKIDKILDGANWSNTLRSPLKDIGVNVNEGEYIVAVNGQSTKDIKDIYSLLIGQTNREVQLSVNSKPTEDGSRKTLVKPIASEANLYYYNWVQDNINYTTEKTNGEVGYIHIPDMGVGGLNEFVRHFYPQLNKKGLIIDVRGNGGGNVSPMIIERLMRKLTYLNYSTGQSEGSTSPSGMHLGPKITLMDKYSASDGDLFPYRFQQLELGKTIGTRSWGGVVGYSGARPLIDGGSLITPSFGPYDKDGSRFVIEGEGVTPDIIVENDPAKLYKGEDAQLNKAIEEILKDIESWNEKITPIPPFPDKSGNK